MLVLLDYISFLGHVVTKDGKIVYPSKKKTARNCIDPLLLSRISVFLGLVGLSVLCVGFNIYCRLFYQVDSKEILF